MYLLAVLEYDGTDFVGFQKQKRGRTVQDELEKALGEFGHGAVRVVGGGRTDAGVHASGQTASFKIDWEHETSTLHRALNAKLPSDLSVKSLEEVREGFSARHCAASRTYVYTVLNQSYRSALQARFALWVSSPLNVEAMSDAAARMVGRRDWSAFGTAPHGGSTVRDLIRAEVWRDGSIILFEFESTAFLYRMVRRMVGTLLQVGRGELDLNEIMQVLEKRRRAGDSVPPNGLALTSVKYNLES